MRFILKLSLLIICLSMSSWSLIPDIDQKYSISIRTGNKSPYVYEPKFHGLPKDKMGNILTEKINSNVVKSKKFSTILPHEKIFVNNNQKDYFIIDPVFNVIRRKFDDTASSESSSREEKKWKDEWKELWVKKKIEALNMTTPRGDVVNMVAARPWGKPCGDPDQHDMPWGSCTLMAECDAEYRIYRGDHFCGRTQFVCCSLQLTGHDMYNGLDISFADSEFKTDSEELHKREQKSMAKKQKRMIRKKQRRNRDRLRRKRKIRKSISKIVSEFKKILDRTYRNATRQKKKKSKLIKQWMKNMKKSNKGADVQVSLNEQEIIKVDLALLNRLHQLKDINLQFVGNQTFRDIIVNGTISKKNARALIARYPDLADAINITRRNGGSDDVDKLGDKPDYSDYDVEYGFIYF